MLGSLKCDCNILLIVYQACLVQRSCWVVGCLVLPPGLWWCPIPFAARSSVGVYKESGARRVRHLFMPYMHVVCDDDDAAPLVSLSRDLSSVVKRRNNSLFFNGQHW